MKLYLAHNFFARDWLPIVVSMLEEQGHTCTSSWIYDDAHTNGGLKRDSAVIDLIDIDRSDCLVFFTEQSGPTPGQGKYFELGYAHAKGMKIILVGTEDRCVFYFLPGMKRVSTVTELLKLVQPERVNA